MISEFKKEGKCRFQISNPLPVSSGYFCFFLQKDSKYTKELSHGYATYQLKNIRQLSKQCYFSLGRLWETGLTRFWVEQSVSYRKADKCFVKNERKNKTRQVAIKLQDLSRYICIYVMSLT